MMDLDRKTYDSPEEIVVQAHRWITKNQRMLVCIDGYSIIVDRSVIRSYEVMLSTCVYVAETPGRFSKKDEFKVLMHSDGRPYEGWDSADKFIESARLAWYMNHQSEEAKRLEKEKSDAIRKRILEERAGQRGNV